MLQRIQTVYLFFSVLLLASLLWVPLAEISSGADILNFNINGIYKGSEKIFNGLPLLLFLLLILILHLYVIFSYKHRIRQMRILGFTIILLIGLFGLFFYFTYSGLNGATVSFKVPVAFPVVAAILDYLAIRNIGKDEALIRSVNRLRP